MSSNISEEELIKIRAEFDRHPLVVEMRQRQLLFYRNGQYIQAMEIARAINDLYSRAVANLEKETAEKVERVDIAKAQLPAKSRELIMTLIITIYMATDIIESSVLDFNAEIHKRLGPEYNLDMFAPLQDCLKKAQQGLEFLNANSPYMKRDAWGDQCDNMYAMLRHKAAAVIRDFLKSNKEKQERK